MVISSLCLSGSRPICTSQNGKFSRSRQKAARPTTAANWPSPNNGLCWAAALGRCGANARAAEPSRTRCGLIWPASPANALAPSFKFPCKHALHLLVPGANQPDLLLQNTEPEWGSDWLDKRGDTAAKKDAKADAPIDEIAQQKRQDKRDTRVRDGLAALQVWLEDQVRTGLARLPAESPTVWQQQAARLGRCTSHWQCEQRACASRYPGTGTDWPERLSGHMGRLSLAVRAYERIDTLPPDLQQALR